MRTVFIACLIVLASQAQAADVVCGSTGSKTLYPVNDLAISIANKLGLKTCNRSERFKDAVVEGKHTPKVVAITNEQLKEIRKRLKTDKSIPTTF